MSHAALALEAKRNFSGKSAMSSPAATPAMPLQSHAAPLHVASVTLIVHDLARMTAFYEQAMGLDVLDADAGQATLGSGGVAYLHLHRDAHAQPHPARGCGLFHTAFLVPARADLAAWLRHVIKTELALEGMSDHRVSEALYLSDPERNGIEIYADRPRETWVHSGGETVMTTDKLDVHGLLAEPETGRGGRIAPGTRVGHVHLQVGDVARAGAFYQGVLGLDVTHRRPGALFYSSGGYHHHIATNSWHSLDAPPRVPGTTGLSEVTFAVSDPALFERLRGKTGSDANAEVLRVQDPFAIPLVVKSVA
jgi:catechol 2,3-dioxygenase